MTGYDRALEWNEAPAAAERRYARWTVVRAAGAAAARWLPLARIGQVRLYLAPPGCEHDAAALYVEPVVAAKRGRRGAGAEVGVDGKVCEPRFHFDDPGAVALVDAPPSLPPPVPRAGAAPGVAVAVIDVCFDNHREALAGLLRRRPGTALQGPYLVGLPTGAASGAPLSPAPGHGTAMVGIVLHETPAARVGLFQIPAIAGAVPPYLGGASLAVAIAAAVEDWRADVVLVAMSDGAWGTPEPLRDVLREAARTGRDGRGAAIFCSVGDPSRNHARGDDSAALGADDLASQPWVQAVAACDRSGRWYRAYLAYRRGAGGGGGGGGAVYNRFGPAVALSAVGEPRRFGDRIAADDSSQAAALAAAAGARVLAANPALALDELRAILAITADVAPVVDSGRGLAAGQFDGRDRMGHSLKLGYGGVNPRAGCLSAADPICLALLATREIPDSPDDVNPALLMAEAWDDLVRAEAGDPLGGGYLRRRAHMSRVYLRSLAVQEALGWLARHARALAPAPAAPAMEGDGGDDGPSAWASPAEDHGALIERILYAADAFRSGLRPHDPDDQALAAWLRELEIALGRGDGGARAAGLIGTFLARPPTLARRARGSGEAPRQGWCAGDAVLEAGGERRGGQA